MQVARRADFLYAKNGEEKCPKCRWLGEGIFYMEKWRGKMSKMLLARRVDFLYAKKEE